MCSLSDVSISTFRKYGTGFAEDPENTKKAVKENILREIFFKQLYFKIFFSIILN